MGISSVNATLASLLGASSGTSSSGSSSSSSSSSSTGSSANPAYQLSLSQAASNYQIIQGLQSLQSLGEEFASTSLGMATSSLTNNVTSSNTNVASVSTSTDLNYAVNVNQLAASQTLTSGGTFASTASTIGIVGDSLVLKAGSWSGGTFTSSSTTATTITISDNTINGIISSINGAHAGVSASLIGVAGSYSLQLTGTSTGVFGGFAISGSADLSAFEYDGTAKNLTQTTAAVDASYTVNGSLFTSPTNTAVPVAAGVDIDLKAVGAVSIHQAQPPAQALSNIQNLVGYVNSLVQGITQIKGSTLANDQSGITSSFINALTQVGFQSLNGTNVMTTLSDIGFNVQPDGTVQFNQNTFNQAWSKDSNSASFIISQAAIAYSSVASHYAGAGGQVQDQIDRLNMLQTAYVYGAQAAVSASQGQTPQSTSSPYGQTTNPWSGFTFA
jgi:flagellar hook-associated protein 2